MIYEILTTFFIDNFYDNKITETLSKEELFKIIIDYFDKEKPGIILNKEDLIRSLIKREKVGSTGIGKGVATPHTIMISVREIFSILVITNTDISFDALDGEPVNLIWVLVANKSDIQYPHMPYLEMISHIVRQAGVRKLLRSEKNEKEVLDIIIEAEN